MEPFVLHIVHDSVENKRKRYLGSTKDIRGRSAYFADCGIVVREVASKDRSDELMREMLEGMDLSQCHAALFEGETYIESLRYLKENHPSILRLVRAHNANLPHFVDQFRGRVRMLSEPVFHRPVHQGYRKVLAWMFRIYRTPRRIYKALRRFYGGLRQGDILDHLPNIRLMRDMHFALLRYRKDIECAELADYVLAICDWERQYYWGPLAGQTKVTTVPYFLPGIYAETIPTVSRENICVCFMGTGVKIMPLLYDAGINTVKLVRQLGDRLPDWRFYLTGNLKPANAFGNIGRMKSTGHVADPLALLAQARVVTILSDLGMGFKTKILEALMAGCWVFVTEELYGRIPEALRPGCKIIQPDSAELFEKALMESLQAPPAIDYNALLRAEAFAALDRLLPFVSEYQAAISPGKGMSIVSAG